MMNYLAVIANFMPTSILISLLILFVVLVFGHKTLHDYKEVDPTLVVEWITLKRMKVWKITNYLVIGLLLVLAILKVVVAADNNLKEETRKNIAAKKEALIIKSERPKLDRVVFFQCLETIKGSSGIPVESIKACEAVALHENQNGKNTSYY